MKLDTKIGNHKIGTDTIIFNMGATDNCPSKELGLCQVKDICYAKKAERQYKNVILYRKRQEQQWLNYSAEEIANGIKSSIGRRNIKYFRVNESGDFYTQNCVEKLKKVAELSPELIVYTYTARKDLNFENLPKNLIINGSGFMISNEFIPVKSFSGDNKKCAGNCRNCNLCKISKNNKIEMLIH